MPLNTNLNLIILISYSDCTLVSVIQLHEQRCHLRQPKVPKTSTWMGLADKTWDESESRCGVSRGIWDHTGCLCKGSLTSAVEDLVWSPLGLLYMGQKMLDDTGLLQLPKLRHGMWLEAPLSMPDTCTGLAGRTQALQETNTLWSSSWRSGGLPHSTQHEGSL